MLRDQVGIETIAQRVAQQTLQLREGDKVVMTGGITDGTSGNTNLIKVETI